MADSEVSLAGKVAIVTGASRGIGKSIALALGRAGAKLALVARNEADLDSVRAAIEAAGAAALSIPADLRSESAIASAVEATVSAFGRLDVLINNAGVGIYGPFEKMSVADWDTMMSVNARGTFLFCRESIPYLRHQDISHIVNISSVMGVKGYPNQSGYSASKHAMLGMSKAMAREVQPDGIRVHAICPGGVDTDMSSQSRPDLDRGILMQPEEIADWVLFLLTRRGNAMIDEIHLRRESSTPWA